MSAAIKHVTMKGIAFSGMSTVMVSTLSIGTYLWIVSILDSYELGIVTLGYSLYLMLFLFKDFGLTPAIVSSRELTDGFVSSVYSLRLVITSVLSVVGITVSIVVPEVSGLDELRPILVIMVLALFAEAAGFLSNALLQRELEFRKLAALDVLCALVAAVVTVTVALSGYPIQALFAGMLASALVRTAGLLHYRPVRVPLTRNALSNKELLSFGGKLFSIRLVFYSLLNLNVFVLGYIDVSSLGVYGLAYQWASKPAEMVINVLSRVMLPTFSALARDGAKLFAGYVLSLRHLSIATVTAFVVLLGISPSFMRLLYGTKWNECVPVLEILLVFGLLRVLAEPAGSLLVSVNRPGLYLGTCLVGLGSLAIMILFVGGRYGPLGFAYMMAAAYSLHLTALWVTVCWNFEVGITSIVTAIIRPAIAAFLAVTTMLAMRSFVDPQYSDLVGFGAALVVYMFVLAAIARDDLTVSVRYALEAFGVKTLTRSSSE